MEDTINFHTPIHYAIMPFRALCGADVADQSTTRVADDFGCQKRVTCAACFWAAQKVVEDVAPAWRDAIVPAIEKAVAAFAQSAEEMATSSLWAAWWESLPPELRRETMRGDDTPGNIGALMAYARDYNWRHPCKKISWRRLNRRQRQAAVELYAKVV